LALDILGGVSGVSHSPYEGNRRKTMIDKTFLKASTLALVLAFAVSPLALAADRMQSNSGQSTQQTGQSTMGTSSQHDQGQSMSATVTEVDQQQGMITLRSSNGKTVELEVPEAMLSDLQSGDRVEVSIRKATHGMDGQSQGQSGGMQHQSGQPDRSR
jgi:Cu/Ag efflux protein CusF